MDFEVKMLERVWGVNNFLMLSFLIQQFDAYLKMSIIKETMRGLEETEYMKTLCTLFSCPANLNLLKK